MAKGYLMPEEVHLGNIWLKTVFAPSIKADANTPCEYVYGWGSLQISATRWCKDLYDAIRNIKWASDGSIYDQYINDLARLTYYTEKDPSPTRKEYKFTRKQLANILVNMCNNARIYWDDTIHTSQEKEYFLRTLFGKALNDFGCFVSYVPPQPKMTTRNTSAGASTGSSGSQLNKTNCGGLASTEKVSFPGAFAYWIKGDFTTPSSNSARVHVSPLGQSAPLRVKYRSGNGYDDCILYFQTPNEADAFKSAIDSGRPSDVTPLGVAKTKTDPNGYFKVMTTAGEAYIRAKKLKESLGGQDGEQLQECAEQTAEESHAEKMTKANEALKIIMSD